MAYYNDHGLGIDNLDYGIDAGGVADYKANLKLSLLTTVCDKIDDVAAVNTALDLAWQGASRDRFDEIFTKQRQAIKDDLIVEYDDVEARLDELTMNYINQDQNMIVEE